MIHYTGLSLRRFPLFGVLAWLCFITVSVWGGEPKGASAAQNQKAAASRDLALPDPAGDLESQLRSVPQVDLDPDYHKKSKQDLAQVATEILNGNKDDSKNSTDAFVRKLIQGRKDLAGMPFLLGKDCSLSATQAGTLLDGSLRIRQALAAVSPAKAKTISTPAEDERAVQLFWNQIHKKSGQMWKNPDQLPALQQILLAESKEHRRRLVAHVSDVKGAQASEILARLAIFDLDLEVREMAIAALRTRPKEEYRATLAHGLRYPWASVVDNATHVLVSLHMNETIPNLVALFDEPAPGSPYSEPGKDGKPKLMVRELVRVNHHRNCLLCHAPLDVSAEDARRGLSRLPVGPVTSAQEPLPPSRSTVYYASRKGITLVRADITYLRQDFSVQQKVENPGNWPAVQRFDFLVRTRELTSKEAEAWANKGVAHYLQSSVSSKYRETIADTLRRLTSKDAPATSRAWREALGLPIPSTEPMR